MKSKMEKKERKKKEDKRKIERRQRSTRGSEEFYIKFPPWFNVFQMSAAQIRRHNVSKVKRKQQYMATPSFSYASVLKVRKHLWILPAATTTVRF